MRAGDYLFISGCVSWDMEGTWVEIKRLVHPDLLLEVEITAYHAK